VATKEASANKELSAPRLVALSPGLLGVGTALDTRAKATDPDPDADPDSGPPESVDPPTQRPPAPLEAADLEPPTAIVAAPTGDIFESAPDSATPLDSQDYVEEPPKRLPQAPPVRRFPTAPRAPTKAEPPSATSAPKIEELVHGPAVAPEDKKGPPRKRQASGDLTDDLLSGDLGFDAPVPIAPPDAGALLRAPISAAPPPDQPATPSSKPPTAAATKKPESEKSSARGFVWVVALVALGGAAFAFRDRLPTGSPKAAATSENVAKSEPAAPAPPPVTPPEPAPAAPEPTASAAPEPVASAASPEATDTATPTPSPVVAKPGKPLRSTPDATPKPEPAPTPTVAPPREPPAEATGPFDAAAARASLDTAAAQASSCRKPGDPSGVAVVTITFSPSGRVTTANIGGPPFAATPTGGCIASTLRKARVPPFIGEMVTVRKTVTIQ
jgi:hypothetical protein